ncbi:hypothetical protein BpHYR1_044314 [Brachionus plicatilis]|uniref:Uncharacterized protein n=1 Tax=Brachionus plicatilis TaxID=10195 RepID=A0A3M7T6A6_BRAPC|nr:hypothetical protein BpHYR1_044314 [Brachionus plicatilis]
MKIQLITILSTLMVLGHQAQDFGVQFSEPSLVESHSSNVFVVKLKNQELNEHNLYITSQADGSVYEKIEFKFSGLSHVKRKFQIEADNTPSLTLKFGQKLEAEFTGQYEFRAIRRDGSEQVVSWYIYFYPEVLDLIKA